MRPQVGQVINNKYRLIRLIGDGGMGSVYEARHEVLGMSVALKFLHPELSRRQGLVQRFLQEARVSAQIQSPHVVRVTDVDQTANGLAFIVLEYLEGKTLQALYEELYRAGQRLSYTDALEYSMQMLEGVEAAHRAGVVHRDLKPDNVIITTGPKGRQLLKLLDFGIAKLKVSGEFDRGLTRPGVIMGTPEYMAPEQAYSADAVDARADIFSLGVMIFEMLAGRRPVGGDDPQQIASAYLSGQISKLPELMPTVSPDLATAVHRAMAPLARDRWDDVAALRDALEPFAIAAKAPSVMQSSPSMPGVTPSPSAVSSSIPGGVTDRVSVPNLLTNANLEPPRAVPKTLPPEGDAPAPSATPLGGFGFPPGDVAAAGAPMAAASWAGTPNPNAAFMAPTATNPPYQPVDGGSTSLATPMDFSPRASGTAIRVGGTAAGADYGYPPVPHLDPGYAAVAPMGGAIAAPQPAAPTRRKSSGTSFAMILLLAAGIAGAVVGGLYLAQQRAKVDDHNDDPVPVTTGTVRSDPPPAPTPTQVATPAPTPTPKPIPYKPQPQPKPSGSQANPKPPPSAQPSSNVPILPTVLVLPSALPPFLHRQQPQQDPPRNESPRQEPQEPPRGTYEQPPRRAEPENPRPRPPRYRPRRPSYYDPSGPPPGYGPGYGPSGPPGYGPNGPGGPPGPPPNQRPYRL